mmetsp:Transcript_23375/g.72225  ORF Transcript_23375/g.72225 Transcript_23375/m.72225 type:complete len:395 (+) Transcript_23375:39-1223(+)
MTNPNFAGFASSDGRHINEMPTTTPGPGSYLKVPSTKRMPALNNCFRTTTARLAPSTPGSTAFSQSTIAGNPGPGHYYHESWAPWTRSPASSKFMSAAARVIKATGENSVALRFNPPTIPRKEQSNGYERSSLGPKPIPAPKEVFTGIGRDTVGPAFYSLPGAIGISGGTSFSKSSNQRQVFSSPNTPGPGNYYPCSNLQSSHCLSSFKSKTPMAFEISAMSKQTNVLGPGAFLSPTFERLNDWPSVLQCFGATTERRGWYRPKYLPFLEPSSTTVPGPGSYGDPKSSFCTRLQRRLGDHPIPFSSTDLRPCLRPSAQATDASVYKLEPGPGDYSLESMSIANVIKKRTYGHNAMFGSCTTRFDPNTLAPPQINLLGQPLGESPTGRRLKHGFS